LLRSAELRTDQQRYAGRLYDLAADLGGKRKVLIQHKGLATPKLGAWRWPALNKKISILCGLFFGRFRQ